MQKDPEVGSRVVPGEIPRSSKGGTPVKRRPGERWLRRGESEMRRAENEEQWENRDTEVEKHLEISATPSFSRWRN